MKKILMAAALLVAASAGFTAAQLPGFRSGRLPYGLSSFQTVTITLGDFVVTADSALLRGDGQFHVGAKSREVHRGFAACCGPPSRRTRAKVGIDLAG
jgi:hypothetical protein